LPGTRGFAGPLDGVLVRDVLGRHPLFWDADSTGAWCHDPTTLASPRRVPAGHIQTPAGPRRRWTLPSPDPVEGPAAVDAIRAAIRTSVEGVSTQGLALAFSGGLDSAILAATLDAPLYVAGFPDSPDVAAARDAAARLGADLTVVTLDHDALARAVPRVATATRRTNAMDVQIALPLFLVAERVAADGFDRLAVGQGADELFGGYAKVAKAPEDPRVEADTVRGARREMVATLPDQLERDVLAIRAAGVAPVAPLLHDAVAEAALALPGDALVTDAGERKWALRLAARAWLPDPLAFRKKRAVQYGSRAARELDRLARQAGFKRRMDDHVGRYVDSLLE
jgi:asparagine synthase (glutamine-hydrolysing)